jgi:hypothetical protein
MRRGEEEEESLGTFLEERKAHLFEGLFIEVREGAFAWRCFHGGGGTFMSRDAF